MIDQWSKQILKITQISLIKIKLSHKKIKLMKKGLRSFGIKPWRSNNRVV